MKQVEEGEWAGADRETVRARSNKQGGCGATGELGWAGGCGWATAGCLGCNVSTDVRARTRVAGGSGPTATPPEQSLLMNLE